MLRSSDSNIDNLGVGAGARILLGYGVVAINDEQTSKGDLAPGSAVSIEEHEFARCDIGKVLQSRASGAWDPRWCCVFMNIALERRRYWKIVRWRI